MQSKAAVWTVPRPTNWCWWIKSPVHTAAEHTICSSTISLIRDTYFYFLCHFMGNQSAFCSRVTIFISLLLQFAVFEARQIQHLHFSPSFHQLYCKQKAKSCPSDRQEISATAVFTSKNQWTRRAAISPSRRNLYALHLWLYDRHLQCCHRWQAQPGMSLIYLNFSNIIFVCCMRERVQHLALKDTVCSFQLSCAR